MWTDEALCGDDPNPELWFPKSDTPQYLVDEAKYICAHCPVRKQCATTTFGNGKLPAHGIWAGVLRGYSDAIT